MNVMIIGAGMTGSQLARRLINEGNAVTLIDNNNELTDHLSNRLDCVVLNIDGNNLANLEEAGIGKQDALVVLTDNDEVNIITCSLVNAVYPDILKIARVSKYGYYLNTLESAKKDVNSFAKNRGPVYGVNVMVNPDVVAADAIVKAMDHGAISNILSFGKNNEYEITSLVVEKGSKLDNFELKKIRTITDKRIVAAFYETFDENEKGLVSRLPSGDTVFKAGDRIGFISRYEDIPEVMELCGTKADKIRKIMVYGAGRIGTLVSEKIVEKDKKANRLKSLFSIKKSSQSLTIVDSNKANLKAASERFPSARILAGDITDESFIEEEKLNDFDLMICDSDNYELNMVVASYFESLGVERTISLVQHSQFEHIARKIGVDVAIPLRDTIVDTIISHLHGKSVKGIHSVANGEFEIVECDMSSSSKIAGSMLKDITNHDDYLILLVRKHGQEQYELPGGTTVLSGGDHLVLIQKNGSNKTLEMFSK